MATEKYTNDARSTLASSMTDSDDHLHVATGEGAKFPSAGNFHIRVEDEYMLVTSRSTDSLSVTRAQESSTAVAHDSPAAVSLVLTAASLDAIRADMHQTGAYASAVAEKAGNIYLPSDGYHVWRDTGAALTPWGPIYPMTAPVAGDFAWVNQESATLTSTSGGLCIYAPAGNGDARILKKAAPSRPYSIIAAFLFTRWTEGTPGGGLGWRQSSDGKLHTFTCYQDGTTGLSFSSAKWDNPDTGADSNYTYGVVATLARPLFWMKIFEDNTNRQCYLSGDGVNWMLYHTIGRTDYLTADEILFFNSASTNYASYGTLLSWKEGTS